MIRIISFYFLIGTFLCLKTSAQCDSSFFRYKRDIIDFVGSKVDSACGFYDFKASVHIKFTDLTGNSYHHTSAKSPAGFYCWITDTCYNLSKEEYEVKNEIKALMVEKEKFSGFIVADQFDSIDLHKQQTLSEVIENPIEGWDQIAWDYFKHQGYQYSSEISFNIPVYIFKNKQLTKFYFVKLKISNAKGSNISMLSMLEVI